MNYCSNASEKMVITQDLPIFEERTNLCQCSKELGLDHFVKIKIARKMFVQIQDYKSYVNRFIKFNNSFLNYKLFCKYMTS